MIQNYYFFGTSYSSGGGLGFDWNNSEYIELKNKAYPTKPKLNNYKYSLSGRLEELFDENKIQYNSIKNFSKPGYGTELTLREINKLIFSSDFDSDNSLLLIELTDNLFRRDMYYNPISDFIVGNHHDIKIDDTFACVSNWWKDSKNVTQKIKDNFSVIKKYYELTHDFETELNKNINQVLSLVCMLDKLKINYLFTSGPYFIPKHKLDKINFDSNKVIINDIKKFISDNKMSIKDESNGIVYDNHHAGYKGTDYITKIIFNKLIYLNIINNQPLDVKKSLRFI